MDYLSENEMITDYARELKINVLQNELEDFITLATQENWGRRTLIARTWKKKSR
jgi:hypothetical protein